MSAVLDMSAFCIGLQSLGTAQYTLAQGLCTSTPVAAGEAAAEFHEASLCLSCSAEHLNAERCTCSPQGILNLKPVLGCAGQQRGVLGGRSYQV